MPSFTALRISEQIEHIGMGVTDVGACPGAPLLANAVPAAPAEHIPASTGLTSLNRYRRFPGISNVSVMSSTKISVDVPLLSALSMQLPSAAAAIQNALLKAYLRQNPVLDARPPSHMTDELFIAANYHSAGQSMLTCSSSMLVRRRRSLPWPPLCTPRGTSRT